MDKKMKALVLHGVGDFRYEDVKIPELTVGTVLVRVRAAGICGSDIPRVYVNGTYHFPTIPGHEFAGEVVAVRESASLEERGWLGKRVGIFPLIPCRECDPCRKRLYEMCKQYSYLGSREDGGFAEYVRVPVWNLLELPEQVGFRQAAMMEPMAVAVHAIRKALGPRFGLSLRKGVPDGLVKENLELSIAVCGLGTIGMLVVMFLQAMGFRNIIGIGNKDFQREIFLQVTEQSGIFIDSRSQKDVSETVREQTGDGTDVFFECVGRPETVVVAMSAAAPGGSVQLVGNPSGDMLFPRDVYWQILRRQLIVTGTWNSGYTQDPGDDWNYVLRLLEQERIHPELLITHVFSMEELRKGFEIMRDKTEPYIKVMGVF